MHIETVLLHKEGAAVKMLVLATIVGGLLAGGLGWAGEIAIMQGDDESHGTLYDFDAVKLYNDSQGAAGTIYDSGTIQRYQFNNPSGQNQSGTIYRFGVPQTVPTIPAPQNTPVAPLFPMIPNTGVIQPVPVIPYSGFAGPGGVAGGMGSSRGR